MRSRSVSEIQTTFRDLNLHPNNLESPSPPTPLMISPVTVHPTSIPVPYGYASTQYHSNDARNVFADHSQINAVPRPLSSRLQPRPNGSIGSKGSNRPNAPRGLSESQQKVAANYDVLATNRSRNTLKQRSESITRNVRDMNNWLKYVAISNGVREAFYENHCQKIKVLDLGSGSGGDLYKFRGNKLYLKLYVAVDFSPKCIESATHKFESIVQDQNRRRAVPQRKRLKFGRINAYGQTADEYFGGELFDAYFLCEDMTSSNLRRHRVMMEQGPFHLLNVQFSLHYAFESMQTLNSWLDTVAESTMTGSFMVCSLVRDEIVLRRVLDAKRQSGNSGDRGNLKEYRYANELQSISMTQDMTNRVLREQQKLGIEADASSKVDWESVKNDQRDYSNLVGISYRYFQRDCVEGDGDGVQEYLVPLHALCVMLWRRCRMKLVANEDSTGMVCRFSRKSPYKFGFKKGRELHKVRWSDCEIDLLDTYRYVTFQRMAQDQE